MLELPRTLFPAPTLLLALALSSCGGEAQPPATHDGPAAPSGFTDITAASGLPTAFPDVVGTHALIEIMGPGVALFDYDGDGDLDLLEGRCPPPGHVGDPAPDRLWQRQADGRYVDVSAASGLTDPGYGQGFAIGDVDNDGDPDVFCANYGPDAFFLNQGDGTFVDATAESGFTGTDEWSCSAAFFDADRDGDLDLFVPHYAKFDASVVCRRQDSSQEYCGPLAFPSTVDSLWINDGSGRFREEGAARGITAKGSGLGVVCADFTGDGWCDVYVANDASANHLWINQGDGNFVEDGVERGVAVNRFGKPEGSMGIAIGDVDGNAELDLLVTNMEEENNTLYAGDGQAFQDVTPHAGMTRFDLSKTGFGCAFFDVDLDGDLDLAVANGRVRRSKPESKARLAPFWQPFGECNALFMNDGTAAFVRADEGLGGDFIARAEITRGLAVGDLDGDGDLDLVTSQSIGPLRIYRNDAPHRGHWLQVRARTGKRDALGADIKVRCGTRVWRSVAMAGQSYVSSRDPRAHFGLGEATLVDGIEVIWPSGRRERFDGGAVDRAIEIVEGAGRAP